MRNFFCVNVHSELSSSATSTTCKTRAYWQAVRHRQQTSYSRSKIFLRCKSRTSCRRDKTAERDSRRKRHHRARLFARRLRSDYTGTSILDRNFRKRRHSPKIERCPQLSSRSPPTRACPPTKFSVDLPELVVVVDTAFDTFEPRLQFSLTVREVAVKNFAQIDSPQ